ncbi:hypothetical protein ACA910_003321 [Epithemia clementina (nom. ined.)]
MTKPIALTIALLLANAEAFSVVGTGRSSQRAESSSGIGKRRLTGSSRLGYYVDLLREDDFVPISTAPFATGATGLQSSITSQEQSLNRGEDEPAQQGAAPVPVAKEPKHWELPAHHQYSSNDVRPSQYFLDVELQIGRASICLAFVLFGTELVTGYSLPEIILTQLGTN